MKKRKILLWTTFGISAALVIAGFILPPLGIIDNSVLIAVGELGFFGVLAEIPSYLESKKDIKIQHGNASITVADMNNNDED